jgi:hypothetical protein
VSEHTRALRQHRAPNLEVELAAVIAEVARDSNLSEQGLPRLVERIERFGRFVERGFDVVSLCDVTPAHAAAFVTALHSSSAHPSVATMHLRRSAVRLLFRVARELGLVAGDPTLDLRLPPRAGTKVRPVTDDEVALCRAATLQSLTATRASAAWALAEATARTAELPEIAVADLDLAQRRVWLHGSPRTDARWGALNEWGTQQLERRVDALGRDCDPSTLVIYEGTGSPESRQASSCQAIGETLRRAGLGDEPDVRPLSVAAWAGARVFAENGRIEDVARALGVRSLDGAAGLIGFDWHSSGAT